MASIYFIPNSLNVAIDEDARDKCGESAARLLTYMATLLELEQRGVLDRLDPGLPFDVQERRLIYVSPRLRDWLQGPLLGLVGEGELSPAEQLADMLERFCSGETLRIGPHLNVLNPVRRPGAAGQAAWKLKTYDARIFGWFARRDVFVGVSGHPAAHVKKHRLYPALADEVVRFRDGLDLDPPKFIPGENPYGVVSNYDPG